MYIFASRSFPILGPFLYEMGDVVGLGYKGDANALTPDQRERLIEKMVEKFNLSRKEVEDALKDGVVPIKAEGVIVSICRAHVMSAMPDEPWADEEEESWRDELEEDLEQEESARAYDGDGF